MANSYLTGSLVRVATYSGTIAAPVGGFRDVNNALADPTIVTLKYKPGAKANTVIVVSPSAPIVKDGTGLYHADLDTTGLLIPLDEWTYQWIGTGVIQATAKTIFEVTLGL
jgi:hypothetical protein